jgi:hypothetical protein
MILNRYELYKTLNHHNSVNIKPRKMILPSLDLSHYGESDQKKIIKIQSLDAEKINFEVFYYLYLIKII